MSGNNKGNDEDSGGKLVPLVASKVLAVPGYIPAGSYDRPELNIDGDLAAKVRRHMVRHFVPALGEKKKPPRTLVVQGKPGEGKTNTILVTASRMGVDSLLVSSAGELSGAEEGAPVRALKERERQVAELTKDRRQPMVALFDDLEQVMAQPPGVEVTINQQLLIGYWQYLSDFGGMRAPWGAIPWIATGNDYRYVRASALRDGRAAFFTYRPSVEQKIAMACGLFSDGDEKGVRKLVEAHKGRSIAFFGWVKTELEGDKIDTLLDNFGNDFAAMEKAVRAWSTEVDMQRALTIADKLAAMKADGFLEEVADVTA